MFFIMPLIIKLINFVCGVYNIMLNVPFQCIDVVNIL